MLEILNELSAQCAFEYPYLLPTLFTLMGLCVGSYLNVAIYRIPRGLSTNEPKRSFCPNCKKLIPWYLNIPVFSWLMLRGRSACCHLPISPRYLGVELLTGCLFLWVSSAFCYENLMAQMGLCLWVAVAIVITFMDWEQMLVSSRVCLVGLAAGLLVGIFAPGIASDGASIEAWEGLLYSALGAGLSFVLVKAIAVLGRAAFGRKTEKFERECPWSMKATDDEQDIILTVNGKDYLFSELFLEYGHRLILKDATLELGPHDQGKTASLGQDASQKGDIGIIATHFLLPSGEKIPLLEYDSAAGTCRGWVQFREAMGSGDAWIALAIGALCGWQGFVVALVAGSLIGILWAILTRVSRGQPMPFGPCLILGTFVYLLGWHQVLWNYYMSFL